ncbi:YlxR family protein [Mangrovactinospora gilvigrisea]|uniref:YlxR family protein n=1 Tax=Mangrovactinospora gilvigrisea TaxID=1428644 RepID=UPI0008FC8047|nr:YlxR family protein [Mangrovactinospora gilvigrisea]
MSGRTRGPACPSPAVPERTCVGCRKRSAKTDLLRAVVNEGECVPDPRGTLPGRGAYLHQDRGCLDLAVRRRAFPRAFRLPGPLDVTGLREFVERQADRCNEGTK